LDVRGGCACYQELLVLYKYTIIIIIIIIIIIVIVIIIFFFYRPNENGIIDSIRKQAAGKQTYEPAYSQLFQYFPFC